MFARFHSARPARLTRHGAACVYSFTYFASFTSLTTSKFFIIRTSETPLLQLLYNPHFQDPFGSAGNNGLTVTNFPDITPLESALTDTPRICGKQRTYNPFGIRTYKKSSRKSFRIRTYKKVGGGGSFPSADLSTFNRPALRRAVIETSPAGRGRWSRTGAGIGTNRPGASPPARRSVSRFHEEFCAARRRLPPAIAPGRSGPW